MKRLTIFFLFIVLVVFNARSQYNNSPTYYSNNSNSIRDTSKSDNTGLLGFYGMITNPTGNFAASGYQSGGGFGMEFYTNNIISHSHSGMNVKFGGSLYYAGQGSVTNNVRLHDPKNAPGTQRLNNYFYGADLRLKFLYDKGSVRPYVDIFGGITNFSSNQKLTIDNPRYGYQSSTNTPFYSTTVYTYGASFGMLIKLSSNVFFDLKSTLMTSGTPVSFINFNQMYYDGYMYLPANKLELPSMINVQFGLVFKLRSSGNSGSRMRSYSSPVYSGSGYYYHSYRSSYHRSCGSYHSGGGGRPLR